MDSPGAPVAPRAPFQILTIGDPHFKSDNGETTEELTTKIIDLIEKSLESIDAVAVLGDILHRHEKIDLHPLCRATNFLIKIHHILQGSPKPKYLYILIGNHDRSSNRDFMTSDHGFNPLKMWKNTFVADKAMIHSPRDDFNILLMPYVPPGRFKEAYSTVISEEKINSSINLVLAHQEFQGAKMNTITSNEGDPWDSIKPICVSGHIHDYQILKANLIYIGTPIQHGFSDTCRKTVSLFKFDRDHPDSVGKDLDLYIFTEERIDLKIKGRITIKGTPESFDSLDLPIDTYFIKVKMTGTKRSLKTFTESKKYKEAIEKGIVFQFLEIPSVEITESSKDSVHVDVNFSKRLEKMLEESDHKIREKFKEIFL